MDNFQKFFAEANEIFEDVNKNILFYSPEKSLYLLDEAVNKYLKSLLEFYEVKYDKGISNEELVNILEEKTTIKIPPFKELLFELSYSYCEGGCSTYINYKELPTKYLQPVEDLASFVIDEIGIWNLEVKG